MSSVVAVRVNGVDVTSQSRLQGATIRQVQGPGANTARMSFDAEAVSEGQQITVVLVSESPERLLFAGEIQALTETYDLQNAFQRWDATLIDRTFAANKRRPFGTWTDIPAGQIALEIATAYAPDCTTSGIQISPALPTVTIAFDGTKPFMACLQALALAIPGGTATLSYANDLALFTTYTGETPDPVDDTHRPLNTPPLAFSTDLSQVRTRMLGRGLATKILTDVSRYETILPVGDATGFGIASSPSSGRVILGFVPSAVPTLVVTYDGVQLGGTASTVKGTNQSPGTPTKTVSDTVTDGHVLGTVLYKVAFLGPLGESELSSSVSATTTRVSNGGNGGGVGTATNNGAGNVNAGSHSWYIVPFTAQGECDALISDFASSTPVGASTFTLSNIQTVSDARVTGLNIYRTKASGTPTQATIFLVGSVQNGATTFVDNVADANLGHVASSVYLAGGSQVTVQTIATGPTGTTGRRIYRTLAGGSDYFRLTDIPDNTTASYVDKAADSSLGAAPPGAGASTVGTAAGATSLPVADCAQFVAGGGWLTNGVRYTGRSASSGAGTLTGIPATGHGSIAVAIAYAATVTAAPALTGLDSGLSPNGLPDEALKDAPVAIWVQRDDASAQAALAVLEGGDGIREDTLYDSSLDELALIAACDAKLDQFSRPNVSVSYPTLDVKSYPGRPVVVQLDTGTGGFFDPAFFDPAFFDTQIGVAGTFIIQDVSVAFFGASHRPMYQVKASSTAFTLRDVIRNTQLLGGV